MTQLSRIYFLPDAIALPYDLEKLLIQSNLLPLVQSSKAQKINLSVEYPCPCRRRGRLVPITLTEAFGCNRCQQIFVVEEGGYVIEKLSTTYPHKCSWRWTGNQWSVVHSMLKESYLPLALGIVIILLLLVLLLALNSPANITNIIPWAIGIVLVAMLPALLLWIAYRR